MKEKQHNILNAQIGSAIQSIRQKRKYSQSQVASGMGLTRTSLVNIEKGRQSLSIEGLLKVCAILKCDPADILPRTPKAISKEVNKVKRVVEEKLLDVNFKW